MIFVSLQRAIKNDIKSSLLSKRISYFFTIILIKYEQKHRLYLFDAWPSFFLLNYTVWTILNSHVMQKDNIFETWRHLELC